MEEEKSVEKLVEKLQAMQNDLSPEEKEEFRAMIELAVRSAAEINAEENRLKEKGADFKKFAEIMKPQSAHAIMLGKKLDDLLK